MDRSRKILSYYGVVNQLKKSVEELTELSLAIQHYLDKKCTISDVVTEIADVSIMVKQLSVIFGEDDVDSEIDRKYDRVNERITNGKRQAFAKLKEEEVQNV